MDGKGRLGTVPYLLSALQVSKYHHEVFDGHNLPERTFGGTPFGGERVLLTNVWCNGCDPEE